MNKRHLLFALLAAGLLGAAGYGLYALGAKQAGTMASALVNMPTNAGTSPSAAPATGPQSTAEGEEATRRHIRAGLKAGDTDPATGSKILYYRDPMVPASKFDKPAKSPFMDMMLVPVYAAGEADQGKTTVSPRIQQNLGVRTAVVTDGTLSPQVSAVGSIAFNERDQATVQSRATGYVERLHVRATLDRVTKGQPLLDLYVPDWVAAQEEFLAVKRMQGSDLALLIDGARQRMRQAGMSDEQIRQVEASGKSQARTTITAPLGGVVVELMAREGMTVMAGTTLFRINGLSTVWANAEVPESQAALVRPGAKVQASSPAAPGMTFDGKVQAILPEVNSATRTLKARLELANPGARLVPGMFVSMQFMGMQAQKSLLVPTEAVIQTGKRTVVILAEENGRFSPVDVQTGLESGGQTEIKRGLQASQRVVVSSQFLIDSEASLKGVETRLNEPPKPADATGATPANTATTAPRHEGEAKVVAMGKEAITLSHGPIATLKWGAMTMDFKRPALPDLPKNLAVGSQVGFEFFMDAEGLPQLTRVTPMALAAPAPEPGAPPMAAGGQK